MVGFSAEPRLGNTRFPESKTSFTYLLLSRDGKEIVQICKAFYSYVTLCRSGSNTFRCLLMAWR
jgi:hypothetical protein